LFDCKDRKVIVTGGSRGIGRAIALAFANCGAKLSICARGAEALEQTRRELTGRAAVVHAETCDLAEPEAVKRYVEGAAEALGGIDILVNNATGFENNREMWDACLSVDLLAAVRASDAAQEFLVQSSAGAIVNISSISGLSPSARNPAYAAAKAAVIQFTTSQAVSLAKYGIRVNCVAPGSVEFPGGFWERCKNNDRASYNQVLAGIPLGRLGRPEEIASAVLFLASPLASWVTGHTLVADGGQLLT
jgi:NAD(P)-dependent dehydrogenase (short-subunit alcohol dehydrogenase family)